MRRGLAFEREKGGLSLRVSKEIILLSQEFKKIKFNLKPFIV